MKHTVSEPRTPSVSLAATQFLLLVASVAVGMAARSFRWGLATALLLGGFASIVLRHAQAVALAVNVQTNACLTRLEAKLDALAEKLQTLHSP